MPGSGGKVARRVALVTGASRGIGAETARRLAGSGFDLTIAARSREALDEVAIELRESVGCRVAVVEVDMAQEDSVRNLATRHREAFGSLDVLVLNAGMGSIGPIEMFPVRRFDAMYSVNVRSAYLLVQGLLPLLRAAGATPQGAKVIAIASTTGLVGEPLNAAYGATKAALIILCETLCTEESHTGVAATAVCPGYVATAMTEGLAESVPQDKMLPASDVAEMVVGLTRLSRNTVVPQVVLTRPGPHVWRA